MTGYLKILFYCYAVIIIVGHDCQPGQEYDDYAITGECQPCPVSCVGGCSGPLNIATADGGCNQCNKILLHQSGSQVSSYFKTNLSEKEYHCDQFYLQRR